MKATMHATYRSDVAPALRKEFTIGNVMAVPRISKVTVNTGVGRMLKDGRPTERVISDLALLTGQKPVGRPAKKSIASFKVREGQIVGHTVTLRGKRMWDFLDRLVKLALPMSKDFRGIDPKNVDAAGNLNLGIREHSIFPEVTLENIKDVFGLQVTVSTTAIDRVQGLALLRGLGFPFQKEEAKR